MNSTPKSAALKRLIASLAGLLLGLFCPHLPAQTYVSIQPDNQGQLITGWGYDTEGNGGWSVSPSYAQTLFVTDQMNILRTCIWGTSGKPAHPSAGVVVGSYYDSEVYAIQNAKAANPNVVIIGHKVLDNLTTFPDWTKNSSGVIASQYAIMLADYLQYIQTQSGYAIDVLAMDNERMWNEGTITPSVFNDVVNNLRSLAASRGFHLPSKFIGPENYNPDWSWLSTLISSGWGTNLNIVGTHYYPHRPLSDLQTLVADGNSRPVWHTEVHWDDKYGDVITNAERALVTLFDCTDTGLSGYIWWQYTRSGVKGSLEQAFCTSTTGTRPVSTGNSINGSGSTLFTLVTRAYRSDTGIVIWVLNNTANVYSGCQFNFANSSSGSLVGPASYTQWNASGSTQGTANLLTATNFAVTLNAHTLTMINVGFQPAYYWDCNGTTGGFGTTPAGTWGSSSYWTASSAGTATPTAYTTTTADTVFFGSSLLGFSTAGGPNVPGSVNVGTIIFGSANTANVSLYSSGTINFAAAGTIQNNSSYLSKIYPTLAGAGTSLTFSGAGVMQIYQSSYTGDTIINDATVNLGASGALPSGTAVTLQGTGHINMNGFNNTVQSVTIINGSILGSGTLTLNNVGARGIYSSINNTVPCGIELGSQANSANNLDFGAAAGTTMTFSGAISSAAGYGMDIYGGTGTVIFSAANTYSGLTTISGGTTLQLSGGADRIKSGNDILVGGTLDMNGQSQTFDSVTGGGSITTGGGALTVGSGGSSPTFSGVISETGSLTKSGTGTATLSGANTYSGGTTVNSGQLTISANQTGAGAVTVNNMGTLQMAGYATFPSGINMAVNSGGTWNLNGTSQTVGTLNGGGTISETWAHGGTDTLTVSGGGTFGGSIAGGNGSTLQAIALAKSGANTLTLSGANTYSGGTTISAGTLRLLRSTTSASSGITVNSGATLLFDNNAANWSFTTPAITLNGTLTNYSSGNNYTVLSTGAVTANSPSTIGVYAGGATLAGLYLDGGLQGSAAVTIQSGANGVGVVLRNPNTTYSGALTVNGTASTTPGTGSGVAIGNMSSGSPALSSADFTVNGTMELGNNANGMGWAAFSTGNVNGATTSIDALTGSGVVVANMATAGYTRTLSVGNNGGSGSFSGTIADGANDTLSLIKSGTGTATLSGANTYSGGTTFTNGYLTANNNAAFGTGPVTISGSANRLVISDGLTVANNITINASASYNSRGLIENSSTGNATLSGGTITINGLTTAGGHLGSLSGSLTINDAINASVTVVHRLGTVIYGGGGNYANLMVRSGTARLGANNGLSTSATVDLALSGTTALDLSGYNQILAGITRVTAGNTGYITNSSATTDSTLTTTSTSSYAGSIVDGSAHKVALTVNGGSLTLAGTNNYTGATTISNGTLLVSGAIGNSAVTVKAGATLGGTGSFGGAVTVQGGGTLSPGASIGTLTISNRLTLAGTTFVEVNSTNGQSDLVQGVTNLTYGGSLVVSNVAGIQPTNGQTFQLFTVPATFAGNFSSITPALTGGNAWSFNPTNGVLSVVSATASYPTKISFSVTGGTLTLTWPATHLGWWAQSNSLGLANPSNWFDIPGSSSLTNLNIIPSSSRTNVFYRLRSP